MKDMYKKFLILIIIIALVVAVFIFWSKNEENNFFQNNEVTEKDIDIVEQEQIETEEEISQLKEFEMESFVKTVDGVPSPRFSLEEIIVNKGDLVKITITVTSGNHDFKIDEFDVYADTKLNVPTTVEFLADQAGEFVYYCAMPGHRERGHWGTLRVLDY